MGIHKDMGTETKAGQNTACGRPIYQGTTRAQREVLLATPDATPRWVDGARATAWRWSSVTCDECLAARPVHTYPTKTAETLAGVRSRVRSER